MRALSFPAALRGARRRRGKAAVVAALTLASAALGASPAMAFNFGESSDARPGIAYAGGSLYQSWSGTDKNHTVNIGELAFDSSGAYNGWAGINTFSGTNTLAGTGPAITSADISGYSGAQIFVAWTAGNGQLNFAHYVGTGTLSCWYALPEYSNHSPYMVAIADQADTDSMIYLAWTGTDSAHHVNVMAISTKGCVSGISGRVTTLSDTAAAGPAITTDQTNLYLAFPGTDSAHHIYAGRFKVGTTSLAQHTCFCSYSTTDDIGLSINYSGGGELTYRGTNNSVYMMEPTLNSSTIAQNGQTQDGSYSTAHGVDITDVPGGVTIPPGPYDSFVNSANGQPYVDPI